ncbi:MAG: aminotransferase class I/II-fold pyridoxal phosphate-dependent enzyme [Rhodospirillaceae bacterium]
MTIKVAQRANIPPFMVMDVMHDAARLEAEGRSIIHLEVGQPSTGIPRAAAERVAAHLVGAESLGYTLAGGLPALRERIARHYLDFYGTSISPDQVFVTTGSSAGFVVSFLTAFEPGDKVAVAVPGYPAYRHVLKSFDVAPELIHVDASTRYQPTLDHLKALSRLPDGLIVASPANPTGTIIPADEFRALAEFCDHNGIRFISDEIYHGLTYGSAISTAAACSESAVVINSFSKYFSMTGWRLGWLVVPHDLQRAVECVAQNLYIAPPTISQHGGLAVFDSQQELAENVQRYAQNRSVLLERLPALGFDRLAPADGAFYIYADISAFSDDSELFCRRMLHEAGVATTPGLDFDPTHGHKFLRFSFAGSTEDMEEACRRLKKWRDDTNW